MSEAPTTTPSTVDFLNQILTRLTQVEQTLQEIQKQMASSAVTFQQLLTAEQQETTDLSSLATAVNAIITAVANGTFTQARAQSLLTSIQSGDTTVQSLTTQINNTLNPPTSAAPSSGSSSSAS